MRLSSFASSLRMPALAGLCIAAGACTHANDGVSLEQSVPSRNAGMMALAPDQNPMPSERPIATLPGEQVASVKAQGYVDGLRQDILLKGGALHDVRNGITILARTSRRDTLDERVPLVHPSEPQIRSEIGGAFPRLNMQVAERESSNAYGPYGLALGRAGGDVRCAYMWQWIDENRLPAEAAVAGPMSIRVRLCRAGVTFDAMAAEMDHLRIGGQTDVATIDPIGVIEAPAAAREPVVKTRASRSRRVASHHPRHSSHVAGQEPPVAAPAVSDQGPHYMSAAPAPTYRQAETAPSSPKLSGDLPAQAYLGPSASTAPKTAAAKYY